MSITASYRKIAAKLRAESAKENGAIAAELLDLARCYLRLAEQAERNAGSDIAVEFAPKSALEGEGAQRIAWSIRA